MGVDREVLVVLDTVPDIVVDTVVEEIDEVLVV